MLRVSTAHDFLRLHIVELGYHARHPRHVHVSPGKPGHLVTEMMMPLDEWIAVQSPDVFPKTGGTTYPTRAKATAEYLNDKVHPNVEKGALLRDDGYLTDHGPQHIQTVIRRATALVGDLKNSQLDPYEVYLLVMAIHAHDVGNILGRKKHERRLGEVLQHITQLLGGDTVEIRAIKNIAGAHGGSVRGGKDTIGQLPFRDYLFGVPVRHQMLAAILRFADELADDSTRAASIQMKLGQIPKSSEVFHAYAHHLNNVSVDHGTRSVELRFHLHKADALRRYGKGTRRVFLLDEIFARTAKMHAERVYCSRFMRALVPIETINVRIYVFQSPQHEQPVEQIVYSLEEQGYPDELTQFKRLCPDMKWTGEKLKRALLRK